MGVPAGFVALGGPARFVATIGPFYVTETAPWRLGLVAGEEHCNEHGFVEGGAMMALADHAMYFDIVKSTEIRNAATVSLNTDFLANARPGDWIETRPAIVRKTRSLVFTRAEVFAGDDRLLATVTAVWKVVDETGAG